MEEKMKKDLTYDQKQYMKKQYKKYGWLSLAIFVTISLNLACFFATHGLLWWPNHVELAAYICFGMAIIVSIVVYQVKKNTTEVVFDYPNEYIWLAWLRVVVSLFVLRIIWGVSFPETYQSTTFFLTCLIVLGVTTLMLFLEWVEYSFWIGKRPTEIIQIDYDNKHNF